MDARFKIGDRAFKANYGRHEKMVTCPDCLGSTKVRVILGDGTELAIDCGGCDPGGYRGSTGAVKQYDYSTEARPYTVTSVKVSMDGVEYELNHFGGGVYWTAKDGELFATVEEAMADGERQRAEREADENKRLMAKTKDAKSWAWNATYHRKCIKDHEKQIEYHKTKVQICAAKAKEPA